MAPEIPQVESARISKSDSDATISALEYNNYLAQAISGKSSEDNSSDIAQDISYDPTDTESTTFYSNLKLDYSFYTIQSFNKDQDIFISSSSPIEHDIDMFFLGTKGLGGVLHPAGADAPLMNDYGTYPDRSKTSIIYTPASSEEIQGLNWRGPSEYSLNYTAHLAKIHFTVPKTGLYLIRLRTKGNDKIGVADLNVNGDYFYEEVPVSFSEGKHVIPADGSTYACMTMSDNPDSDDALLFIHGNSGRVVGYNDDAPMNRMRTFKLGLYDAFVEQSYKFKTSGFSVSNYSSQKPKSTCKVAIRKLNTINKMPQKPVLTKSSEGDIQAGGYAYVDFGLPSGTLWATYNIGAKSPEEYGDYFSWNFAWIEDTSWGVYWTIPTLDQLQELRKYCASKWVEENGVNGLRIFNDSKSIFLPAAGIMDDSDKTIVTEAGELGCYWSSTPVSSEKDPQSIKAHTLEFTEATISFSSTFEKNYGLPIRPVTSKSAVAGVNSNNLDKITVSVTDGTIMVNGCTPSDTVEVRDISGTLLRSCTAGSTKVALEVGTKGVYVVRVTGKRDVKHVVKLII